MSITIQEFVTKQNALNNKRRLVDGPDISWEDTGAGFRPHIINMPTQGSTAEATGSYPIPAVVTGGTTLTGYAVIFYENGFDQASTGTGTCHVLDLAASDIILSGERIMAMPITITETGDGE